MGVRRQRVRGGQRLARQAGRQAPPHRAGRQGQGQGGRARRARQPLPARAAARDVRRRVRAGRPPRLQAPVLCVRAEPDARDQDRRRGARARPRAPRRRRQRHLAHEQDLRPRVVRHRAHGARAHRRDHARAAAHLYAAAQKGRQRRARPAKSLLRHGEPWDSVEPGRRGQWAPGRPARHAEPALQDHQLAADARRRPRRRQQSALLLGRRRCHRQDLAHPPGGAGRHLLAAEGSRDGQRGGAAPAGARRSRVHPAPRHRAVLLRLWCAGRPPLQRQASAARISSPAA